MKELKELFVSFKRESPEHIKKVTSFVNLLRKNGYDAEMDTFLAQNETAINFDEMMHRVVTDYEKVIIVLSEGYKKSADDFTGGVGAEYSLIISDIKKHPNKYILVSFQGYSEDIFPAGLSSRQIIDLSNPSGFTSLNAKLQGKKRWKFADVNDTKPEVPEEEIDDFTFGSKPTSDSTSTTKTKSDSTASKTNNSSTKKVYIAYNDVDEDKAEKLYDNLKNNGLEVWYRGESLLFGQNAEREMDKAINDANYVLILLTQNSVERSGLFQNEIRYALEKEKSLPENQNFIIPTKLEQNVSVPYSLEGRYPLNLVSNFERGFKRLLRSFGIEGNVDITSYSEAFENESSNGGDGNISSSTSHTNNSDSNSNLSLNHSAIIKKTKDLISQARLEKAIDGLEAYINTNAPQNTAIIATIKHSFKRKTSNLNMAGALTFGEYNRTNNGLILKVFGVLDKLKE